MIERNDYLAKLIRKKENGLIKVITGVRRCGKSYLLFHIYYDYLISHGTSKDHIITLALDDMNNIKYQNPLELNNYLRSLIKDEQMYYIFLDEIQNVATINNPYITDGLQKIGFVNVLNGLMLLPNVDIYVTGSNSKMLSSDVITEFRGRGDEIKVYPLSFKEFYNAYQYDKQQAWYEYYTYGGLPYLLSLSSHEEKSEYLTNLFNLTYIKDVIERNSIQNIDVLNDILNIISSSIGSLTNHHKLSNTFKSLVNKSVTAQTIELYLNHLVEAFLVNKVSRYDIKGKKYIGALYKYYFIDVGLRNARLNFRQKEENHIMENIIYNELLLRGYSVDIGIVEYNYKNENGVSQRSQLEIDFVANKYDKRYYIQSALNVDSDEKYQKEVNSLNRTNDSFKKIIVVKDNIVPYHDDNGILHIGIQQFLLEENAIDM